METQSGLQGQKEAALAKIAQRKAEIEADGSSKVYITEDEAHIARMKLESQEDESDIHYFSDEEIQRIKDAIQNGYRVSFKSRSGNEVQSALYFPKQGMFFLFLLYTGLRCGEATSKQLLSVSPYAIEILQLLLAEEPAGYDGYIVHNDSFQPISSKTLWRRFNKLLKGAGIESCGLHSLRHTCATLLYEKTGGDIKFVSTQLRHKDTGFTAKTYVHQSNKRTKEVLKDFKI